MNRFIIGPDCRDDNCHKCDGDAWDEAADGLVKCQCSCHYPRKSARTAVGMRQDPRTL